jgi:hypothetical protein
LAEKKQGTVVPQVLTTADGSVRTISPTTTVKMAERMLAASRVARAELPKSFHTPSPLNLLLEMFVAEEDTQYYRVSELGFNDGMHPRITERWVAALVEAGLMSVQIDHAALTTEGHSTVTRLIESLYVAQRKLD